MLRPRLTQLATTCNLHGPPLRSTTIDPATRPKLHTPGLLLTLRAVFLGRIALASAIFFAAVFVWLDAPAADTLVASLAFV